MNKQLQLTYDKGIANVPSDAICDDNMLEDSVGMVYDNGEHRPIQQPKLLMTAGSAKILYVHSPNSHTTNYIVLEGESLRWGQKNNNAELVLEEVLVQSVYTDDMQVMALGKTLIVNKSEGVSYFTWKDGSYSQLQTDMPDLDIDFRLVDFRVGDGGDGGDTFDTLSVDNGSVHLDPKGGGQSEYNNIVIGQYSGRRNKAKEDKRFVGPFFVRAALKMYDGTYTKMTPPVLMIPTMMYNAGTNWYWSYGDSSRLWLYIYSCALQYRVGTDYSDYSDLISDITIFASQEIETFNRNADCLLPPSLEGVQSMDIVSVYAETNSNVRARHDNTLHFVFEPIEYAIGSITKAQWHNFKVLVPRSIQDINADIAETSIFYKLADIGLNDLNEWKDAAYKIRDNVLPNLTTQDRLVDEYFGHSKLSGDYAYVYNNRLNLSNVRRTLFAGFEKMIPYDYSTNNVPQYKKVAIHVSVETVDGFVTVEKMIESTSERVGMWFYYPDARAKHVRVYEYISQTNNWSRVLDADLKEHPGHNGAYYFAGLPLDDDYYNPQGYIEPLPPVPASPVEELNNVIVTSEANNPYVFNSNGVNQAGDGSIIAIVANTKALSQGQYGKHPLVAFTTKGIWGLTVDSEGVFVSADPMPREVCNNPDTIIQTDDVVYFSSEQGLMVLVGAEVKCVSEQLNGKNGLDMDFATFLKGAKVGYDYRDSLLWIGREDSDIFWIYSIKNGTFHRYSMSDEEIAARRAGGTTPIFNFVNSYPDYLLQIGSSVFSLVLRPNINADPLSYDGVLTTRPMKFGDGMVLKSIMQLRSVYQMHGSVALHISASNDLVHWRELHSLRNTPWKYYKFRFEFSGMKATDRFSGTALVIQERRTNKLR